jgi:hypothetical protein
MRRAVRDYKYEVNEGRMTEECSQYLIQLQKDWEKHRVKLSIEMLRKEVCTGSFVSCFSLFFVIIDSCWARGERHVIDE